jgi:integrase
MQEALSKGPATDAPPTAPFDGPLTTLGQAADRTFARYYAGTTWATKTRQQLDRMVAHLGADRRLSAIDSATLDTWVATMKAEGLSGATINRYLAALSKVMGFAQARKAIVSRPKVAREKECTGHTRWLTIAEEAHLIGLLRHWGKDDHADVVTCLIDTGMRPSELFELHAQDFTPRTGAIHIWRSKRGENARTIYATPRVKLIFSARLGAPGPMMPYDNGWLRNVWDRARAHLGFGKDDQFSPYVCRHTCASRLIQKGIALPVVSKWLGHKGIQMTMRYAHLAPANFMAAAEALAQSGHA